MDNYVLVCHHLWGVLFESTYRLPAKDLEIIYETKVFRQCKYCKEMWDQALPEPRVILATLEKMQS